MENLIGKKFGRLKILLKRPAHKRFYDCLCDCGQRTTVNIYKVVSGHTKSCGCLRNEKTRLMALKHGFAANGKILPEYMIWVSMKQRCGNPKNKSFHRYGGRGIKVCEKWMRSFSNFINDVGRRPNPLLTLDRKDNDGNYCKSNCRWATRKQQSDNSEQQRILTIRGRSNSVAGWERDMGYKSGLISARLYLGWSAERAIFTKPKTR